MIECKLLGFAANSLKIATPAVSLWFFSTLLVMAVMSDSCWPENIDEYALHYR